MEGWECLEGSGCLTPHPFHYLKSYFEGLDALEGLKGMKGLTAPFITLFF